MAGAFGNWWRRARSPRSRGGVRPEPAQEVDDRSRPTGRGIDPTQLADALRGLIKNHKGKLAGALHLINLDVVRERLGDRWPALAERLLAGIEIILDRRLTSSDLYIRIEGPSYLIVFGGLDDQTAKLKCALIGHEIEKHVFGDDVDLSELLVRASLFRLDEGLSSEPEEIDLAGIIDSIRSGIDQTMPGDRRKPAPSQVHAEQPPAENEPEAAESEPGPLPRPPDEPPARKPGLGYSMLPMSEEPAVPPSSFVYHPIWHVRHDAIATYLCQPVWLRSGGIDRSGEGYVEYSAAHSYEGDLYALEQIRRSFQLLAAERRQVLLTMSVHFETIARSSLRKDFLALAALLAASERRLLTFELVAVEETVPQTRLTELVSILQPFCRRVSLRCELKRRRFHGVKEARIYAVGGEAGGGRTAEAAVLDNMDGFAAAAEGAGLRTYLHGLRSLSLTSAAIASGFDYVDGDPVAAPLDRPGNAYRYSLMDLYRQKLDASMPIVGK